MASPHQIVTRFAPSPTGHLHIGGARTALFCWAFARRNGGKFMIRIEDTDAARSSLESARGILSDLAWLGIENDLGPYLNPDGSVSEHDWPDGRVGTFFQARRVAIYNTHIEQLVRAGRAYAAFETPEETEAQRKAAVAAKQTYRYPRPADVRLGEFNAARWERAQRGDRHVIRLAAPHEEIVVHDQILGDVKIAAGELDDFVIRKADGFPTYHFAVVIDDELMGVTHVLRAQEHLANTPRHVALQRALGFKAPVYGHMPVIANMDGSKMSKRDKAKQARKFLKELRTFAQSQDPDKAWDTMKKLTHYGDRAYFQRAARSLLEGTGLSFDGSSARNVSVQAFQAFESGETDSAEIAEAIGTCFGLPLPEIEVWDFRRNGYLPEAINNFVSLLGWNPGLKTADGKDLEKFDTAFLCHHFSLDRIGKTSSKFDRAKLLSFNADFIGQMTDDQFTDRWLAWMKEHEPVAHAKISTIDRSRLLILAKALKPRAKTLRDAFRPAAFIMVGDDAYEFDAAAVEKNLKAAEGAGRRLLAEFRPRLDTISEWKPETITAAIDGFAKEKGMPNPGGIAQPLRVAITGTSVSPGLGETLAVLGKRSTLARIDRCLERVP